MLTRSVRDHRDAALPSTAWAAYVTLHFYKDQNTESAFVATSINDATKSQSCRLVLPHERLLSVAPHQDERQLQTAAAAGAAHLRIATYSGTNRMWSSQQVTSQQDNLGLVLYLEQLLFNQRMTEL